ncbi:hypothetical protein MMC25_002063 [Agyrium rufum]|nr:hypothetical protein [Agyrium rufum]
MPIKLSIVATLVMIGATLATNLHVNAGCALVGSTAVCASKGSPISVTTGSATIYARFAGDSALYYDYAGCKFNAVWPASYGDVFLGADFCLYDANGNNIYGQCCTTSDLVRNPWNVYYGEEVRVEFTKQN